MTLRYFRLPSRADFADVGREPLYETRVCETCRSLRRRQMRDIELRVGSEAPLVGTTISPELIVREDVARAARSLGIDFVERPVRATGVEFVQLSPKAVLTAQPSSLSTPLIDCATCGGWARLGDARLVVADPMKSGDPPQYASIKGVPSARIVSAWLLVFLRSYSPSIDGEELGIR
jgi:hypothetical protein